MQGFGLAFEQFGLVTSDDYNMLSVEVIYAADNKESLLDAVLATQQSRAIYHLYFRLRNLAVALGAIKTADTCTTMVVSPSKPAVLFDYLLVSFHMACGFGFIKIIEDPS